MWNWQRKDWPNFKYDKRQLEELEAKFILNSGIFLGTLKHIDEEEKENLKIELICQEAYKTSEIEGEILNRESLQSSIRQNFGLKITNNKKATTAEIGIAELMVDLYTSFDKALSHKLLYEWNSLVLYGKKNLITKYRQDDEAMQIVSGPIHKPKIHFEAPPMDCLKEEMTSFIKWFNESNLTPLIRAGITHLYFVSIHPFEDGNGRIARALAEKSLSQSLGQASLISLSLMLEKYRKKYYAALDDSNKDLEITDWLVFFAKAVIDGLRHSQDLIEFLIKKSKFYERHRELMNTREAKVIARIFKEGIDGFAGGLSAENYISITQTSRATATRDLQDLVDKGILKRKGQLKNTRYYLNL